MAGFYEEMQGVATDLLTEFRQGIVTLTVPGASTPGPNPWDPPVTEPPMVHTLKAAVKAVEDKFIDGTTILATDKMVTAAPFGHELGPGDEMSIDGQPVTIVRQMRVPAAGTVVAWKWIVRG